jgi:probable F420-dependent oxidoreductase
MRVGITSFLTDLAISPTELARAVEERGFDSLYLPEHTHMPVRNARPPALVEGVTLGDYRRSVDPFVALAAAAAVTERILLGTCVALVAQHDPIVLAKQIATIDHLSGGRFVFGVGFGWNAEEAADHGIEFSTRRELAREKVACMQALWSQEEAAYEGEMVRLAPCYAWPKPFQQPRVRTLIGGGSGPKVFAAITEWADGWMPVGGGGLTDAVPRLRRAMEDAGRDPATLEVVPIGTIPTPQKLQHLASVGVTEVVLRVPVGSRDDMLRTLDAHAAFARPEAHP